MSLTKSDLAALIESRYEAAWHEAMKQVRSLLAGGHRVTKVTVEGDARKAAHSVEWTENEPDGNGKPEREP